MPGATSRTMLWGAPGRSTIARRGRAGQGGGGGGSGAGEPAHAWRLDRLRRYGLPLLTALADVPVAHLDLSPSNVIVQEPEASNGEAGAVNVVLIDFGENYLLTQDVGSGRLGSEYAKFIAPELLHTRGPGRPSCGHMCPHGPTSARRGHDRLASMRKIASTYASAHPPTANTEQLIAA